MSCWKNHAFSPESLLALLLTVLLCLTIFVPSLFQGRSVSRLGLLERLDVLHNSHLIGDNITVSLDPSACLQTIPKLVFIHDAICKGEMPIWNSLSGCGQPLLADAANCIWNPIDFLIPPMNPELQNLAIIVKIILSAVAAFYLFRVWGAAPWAASTAALGLTFCPRILRLDDLPTLYVPLVFLSFKLFSPYASGKRLGLCAILLALSYSLLHPEIFFIATGAATLIYLGEQIQDGRGFLPVLKSLALLGTLSIALVAPLMFPFLELIPLGYCYKFASSATDHLSAGQFFISLFSQKAPGALFTGVLCLLGLISVLLGQFSCNRHLVIVLLGLLLFCLRPYPLEGFLKLPPLSYLIPEYAISSILTIICLLSSLGLTQLRNYSGKNLGFKFFLGGVGMSLVALPLLFLSGLDSVSGVSPTITPKIVIVSSMIVFIALGLLLFLPEKNRRPGVSLNLPGRIGLKASLLLYLIPVLNLTTLYLPAQAELYQTNSLQFLPLNRKKLIEVLRTSKQRIAACGPGLLVPNTSLLFGLNDLRSCNPLNDARYIRFIMNMGGQLGYCNMIELPSELNRIFDFCGADLILSATPLRTENSDIAAVAPKTESAEQLEFSISGRIIPGLRLLSASSKYLPHSAELQCELEFRAHQLDSGRYQVRILILGDDSKFLWRSSAKELIIPADLTAKEGHCLRMDFLAPVPCRVSQRVIASIDVLDTWTGKSLLADGVPFCKYNGQIRLADFKTRVLDKIVSPDGRFELQYETQDLLRIYRNKHCLGRAYIATRFRNAVSDEQAFDFIKSSLPREDPFVVVQAAVGASRLEPNFEASAISTGGAVNSPVVWLKNCNTDLLFEVETNQGGVFVLSDLYYPGWCAELDGKSCQILRSNYMFRGVRVPGGKHHIRFQYRPVSFLLGIALSTLAALSIVWLIRRSSD